MARYRLLILPLIMGPSILFHNQWVKNFVCMKVCYQTIIQQNIKDINFFVRTDRIKDVLFCANATFPSILTKK